MIDENLSLLSIVAGYRTGYKPLSKPMMQLIDAICGTKKLTLYVIQPYSDGALMIYNINEYGNTNTGVLYALVRVHCQNKTP